MLGLTPVDFLQDPDVAVRVGEVGERLVVPPFRVRTVDPRPGVQVTYRADGYAAFEQFGPRGEDVGHHQVQALGRARRGRGEPGPEPDCAFRAGRYGLDHPHVRTDRGIDDKHEARLLEVELLRAIYVRDGDEHQFELVVHVTSLP